MMEHWWKRYIRWLRPMVDSGNVDAWRRGHMFVVENNVYVLRTWLKMPARSERSSSLDVWRQGCVIGLWRT